MKNLKDIRTVAHYWANRTLESGQASSLSFQGDTLYSYAAAIAKILPNGAVVHSLKEWTITTSTHQSLARQATHHLKSVWCREVSDFPERNMECARRRVAEYLEEAEKPMATKKGGTPTVAAVKARYSNRAAALQVAEQANEYLTACQQSGLALSQTLIDTANLDGIRAEMQRQQAIKAAEVAEQARQRALAALEDLAKWRLGEPCNRYKLDCLPPALRLASSRGTYNTGGLLPDRGSEGEQIIQTSHGAEIPVEDALKLWPLIGVVRRGGRALELQRPTDADALPISKRRLGHYTLDRIEADGSIKVGCHLIAYSEIEGIAKELGLEIA